MGGQDGFRLRFAAELACQVEIDLAGGVVAVIFGQPVYQAVVSVPEVYLGNGYKVYFAAEVVPRGGVERQGAEVNAVGEAQGGAAEDFGVVREGDNGVHVAAESASEEAVGQELHLLFGRVVLSVVRVGWHFQQEAYTETFQPFGQAEGEGVGIVEGADVGGINTRTLSIAQQRGEIRAFAQFAPPAVAQAGQRLPVYHPHPLSRRSHFVVAEAYIGTALPQGFHLAADFLADAVVGAEAVEYNKEYVHCEEIIE